MQIFGGAVVHDIFSLGITGTDALKTTHDGCVNLKMEWGTEADSQIMLITKQFETQLS